MTSKRYDLHVATDAGGHSTELKQGLIEMGFVDDDLVHRGLVFDPDTSPFYSACPLIDVHMTRKDISDSRTLRKLEARADSLVAESGCSGYWHSEYVAWDASISPGGDLRLAPPPFKALQPRPREVHKKWDVHVAFLEQDLAEPLRELLIGHGLYYLVRRKHRGDTAVLTVQGVNSVKEGEQFSRALLWWLVAIGVPAFDFKFEITMSMSVVNRPQLVPPTIDHVSWR
mgnify:CR=1 FL=1